jgi:hypothetical protein
MGGSTPLPPTHPGILLIFRSLRLRSQQHRENGAVLLFGQTSASIENGLVEITQMVSFTSWRLEVRLTAGAAEDGSGVTRSVGSPLYRICEPQSRHG